MVRTCKNLEKRLNFGIGVEQALDSSGAELEINDNENCGQLTQAFP